MVSRTTMSAGLPEPVRLPPPGSDDDRVASAALRAHPRFRAACLASARAAVELYSGTRILNVIASERGRFLVALLTIALHHGLEGPGGLTAARLRTACAKTGLLSAGRAQAMLTLMQWAGFVAAAGGGRLVPTEKLVALHRLRLARQLAACAMVLPEAAPTTARIGEPAVLAGFCLAQSEAFLAGYRLVDYAPALSVFVLRNGGLLALMALLLAEAGELPPEDVGPAALARRFQVSRGEVAAMLREAEDLGLIARVGSRLVLRPALQAALDLFFVAVFQLNAAAAVAGLAWAEGQRPPPPADQALS
jgi:hypothetical protein